MASLLSIVGLLLGLVLILGTYTKVRWLVEPTKTSPIGTFWWIKQRFGPKFLLFYLYVTGLLFVVISSWYIGGLFLGYDPNILIVFS